jgi:hypothetical protein
MKISVITASYNSAATIGATIESFLRQTHPEKGPLLVPARLDPAASTTTCYVRWR